MRYEKEMKKNWKRNEKELKKKLKTTWKKGQIEKGNKSANIKGE